MVESGEIPLAREQRRLAAILAADVVGYSRLMGRDESGTLARLREHRKERLEPTLNRHGGRLVKLTGDGALAEFPSAVDSLRAAIEFQQAMADANRDHPEVTRIVFRVGLHLGDLIVDGDDLYGDGVNVAARLEAEAPPGGIVISGNVHDAVVGRLKAEFDDLGSLALKNIERLIQAFRISWVASDWRPSVSATTAMPLQSEGSRTLPDKPSIAVLPFQNMSGDPEQEYFVDGLVEDIITALSKFKALFVIARNSSFTYKGKVVDIKQVGRELGVRYVLEGSVRKSPDRMRITGQLIDSESGVHLWADRFDGALEDIFNLQDAVTEKVIGTLVPTIERAEIDRARGKSTDNLSAYDCYLKGLACCQNITKENLGDAMRLFRQAIELDPEYSSALGMLLLCYPFRRGYGLVGDPDEESAEVARLVRIVIHTGRDDALALCNAGWAVAYILRDLSAAKGLVERAMALNSNLANGWGISAWINLWSGNAAIAVEHVSRAMRHDPLAMSSRWNVLAHGYYFLDRHVDALSVAQRQLLDDPHGHAWLRIGAASAAFAGLTDLAGRLAANLQAVDPAIRVSRLESYLGPYPAAFLDKYKKGLLMAGLPE